MLYQHQTFFYPLGIREDAFTQNPVQAPEMADMNRLLLSADVIW